MLARRTHRKLTPRARKLLLSADGGRHVEALVSLAPSVDPGDFKEDVERIGACLTAFLDDSHMATVDLEIQQLPELAEIRSVVYIEAEEKLTLDEAVG